MINKNNIEIITNKDRLCERSEPRSYPVVGQARSVSAYSIYKKISFFEQGVGSASSRSAFF